MEENIETPKQPQILTKKSSKTLLLESELQEEKEDALKSKARNKDYKELLLKQKGDQADIYYYLHKKLDDNFDLISELERQIISEQTDRERKKKEYIKQIQDKRELLEKQTTTLQEKVGKLKDSLHTLKETEEKKSTLERRHAELDVELKAELKEHQVAMDRLDRIKIQGKQRLKRAQASKIKETEQKLEKTVKHELKAKTKEIRQTNDKMHSVLRYKSEASEKLVAQHSELTAAGKRLRGQLEVHTSMVKELQKKNSVFEQILEDLNKRLQSLARENMERKEEHAMAYSEGQSLSSSPSRRTLSPTIQEEGSQLSESDDESEEEKAKEKEVFNKEWDIEGWERHIKSLERNFQKTQKDLERVDRRRISLDASCARLSQGQVGLVKMLYYSVCWLQDEVYHLESEAWPSEVRWAADEDQLSRIPLSKLPPRERRRAFEVLLKQLHRYQMMKFDQTHAAMSTVSFPPINQDIRGSPITFRSKVSSMGHSVNHHDDFGSLSSVDSKETFNTPYYLGMGVHKKERFTAEVACQTPWVPTENRFSSVGSRFGLKTSTSVKVSHHKVKMDTPLMSDDTATVQTGISELSFGTQATTLVGLSPRKHRIKGRTVFPPQHPSDAGSVGNRSQSSFVSKKYKPKPPRKGGNISQWPC